MAFVITQNTNGIINAPVAATSTGWEISGPYANHSSCNQGYITLLTDLGLVIGRDYVFTYTVDNRLSGGVQLNAGTTVGTNRTANGTYTETLTLAGNDTIRFFSDGTLRISKFSIYDALTGEQVAKVVSFFDKANKWTADYAYSNDTAAKFIDSYVSWKDGQLWVHNTNPVQNNLYGVQYPSQITLIVNVEYQLEKLFYNFRLDAVGKWYMPSITTPDSNQFPNGMLTQLKKNNFGLIDNKLWSDVLGDVTDPNFAYITDPVQRRLTALFEGRKMQGGWLIVDLRCDDTQYHEISSVETYYTDTFRGI
jgi:hypothetical protein